MRPIAAALLIAGLAAPVLAQTPLKPLPPGMGSPTPAPPQAEAAPPAGDDSALLAGADPTAADRAWGSCRACHGVEPGRHGVGPSLHGIVGAPVAAQDWGRPYSRALRELGAAGAVWDVARLSAFLENPRGFAPGTLMAYAGLRDPADRLNLIAWLAAQAD